MRRIILGIAVFLTSLWGPIWGLLPVRRGLASRRQWKPSRRQSLFSLPILLTINWIQDTSEDERLCHAVLDL